MRTVLIKLLFHFFALFPLRLSQGAGTALGYLAQVIPNSLHKPTKTNIDLCFPESSDQNRTQLFKQSFIELGRTTTESGALLLWNRKRIQKLVREVSGKELVENALAKGKGVILATPHLGAWEMMGLYSSLNYAITSLYRPLRMDHLNPLLKQARERFGATLVPTNASGIRALYKALENNQLVGILPDQDPDEEGGLFAPFFGVKASTMILLPRLAKKTGATIIYCYAERLAKGTGYHIHFFPASVAVQETDITEATAAVNKDVETCIRNSPAQYQWSYKRFKTRPEGESRFY